MLQSDVSNDVLFINKIEAVKAEYLKLNGTDGHPKVMIHQRLLAHNAMNVVLVGGVGPDPAAPLAARDYNRSDFVGFHYGNSRFPLVYTRPDLRERLAESNWLSKLESDFKPLIIDWTDNQILKLFIYLFTRTRE